METKMKKLPESYNLTITELNSLTEFPPDAILVMYSDHYRGNSGDDIFFTDNKGNLMSKDAKIYFKHWNANPDDRGIIQLIAVTHSDGRGAFALYQEFLKLCEHYIEASNNLKLWHSGETVWNINVPDYNNNGCGDSKTFVGCKRTSKFENSTWFRRVSKRSKPETIERKRKEHIKEQETFNTTVLAVLEQNKDKMQSIFSEIGISVRIAYLFKQGYIK